MPESLDTLFRPADTAVPDNRHSIIALLRRLFHGATLALVAVGLTLVILSVGYARSARWARHSRELTRVAREARAAARDGESAVRGYTLAGSESERQRLLDRRIMLRAYVDTLVESTDDNPEQQNRARAVKVAVERWNAQQVEPVLGDPIDEAAPDRALPNPMFVAAIVASLTEFLDAEELVFADRAGSTRQFARATLVALLAELLLLALLQRRIRAHVIVQAQDLVSHRESLAKHATLLEHRNTELSEQSSQLQEQAVELELQAAEAQAITEELEETNRQLTDALAKTEEAQGDAAASARERDALQAQLDHSQRMEAIGRLAGGIAHDFNNFLTIIKGHASFMLAELPASAPMREDAEQVSDAADRAASLTRQLLAFSRRQVLQPRPVLLNETVGRIESLLRRLIGEDITLETQLSPDLELINADPGQIEQIVMNLAVNARDAMPNGGRLSITTANAELSTEFAGRHLGAAPGRYVMLTVSDSGTGIPPELQRQVFEPFFTTKEMGKGTGLGLSTVYGIVKQSGGDLWLYSEPGEGTTFKIYLPVLPELPANPVPTPPRPAAAIGSETILLVEDEAALRTLASRILERYGYTALVAKDGNEALDLVLEGSAKIALVISDVVMPNMGGRLLVQRLRVERPELPILLMSGYTDDVVMQRGIADLQIPYLQKPFTPEQLARKVREVLDTARAA